MDSFEQSIVGTAIQFSGTVVVTLLLAILLRTVRRRFLYYWAAGWCFMALALAALLCNFALPNTHFVALPAYCFGEYVAGYLWLAGCRDLTGGFELTKRDWSLAIPAAIVAIGAPIATRNFNGVMIVHSLVMACLFAAAFAVLFVTRGGTQGAGSGVMMAALFVLTVDFLQYAPLCGYSYYTGVEGQFPHLKYSSLYDLMLEMLLAFGMVMVVMEIVRHELETANHELRATGSRLRQLAQRDPLTGVLNRHAFDALRGEPRGGRPFAGCVAILDIDNLKPINDSHGHAAGDRTIRMIADAARAVIRPEDWLFRWGGDEFLILWLGTIKELDAAARLDKLNEEVARNSRAEAVPFPFEPGVSFGLAAFEGVEDLDAAIHAADERMYARKQARRKAAVKT